MLGPNARLSIHTAHVESWLSSPKTHPSILRQPSVNSNHAKQTLIRCSSKDFAVMAEQPSSPPAFDRVRRCQVLVVQPRLGADHCLREVLTVVQTSDSPPTGRQAAPFEPRHVSGRHRPPASSSSDANAVLWLLLFAAAPAGGLMPPPRDTALLPAPLATS